MKCLIEMEMAKIKGKLAFSIAFVPPPFQYFFTAAWKMLSFPSPESIIRR